MPMGLFKRKSKLDKLEAEYQNLLKLSHKLSTSNRAKSDEVYAQADAVLKQIELLSKEEK